MTVSEKNKQDLEKFYAPPRVELVIFDCDGVLVDSEPVSQKAVIDFAAKYGVTLTPKEAEHYFLGHAMPQIVKTLSEMAPKKLPEDAEEEIRNLFISLMKEHLAPLEGVELLLQRLNKAGIPFRVGSNSSLREMQVKFKSSGLAKEIKPDHIHSAADLKKPKPDPAVYLLGAAESGVPAEKTVVIEDSNTGAEAAHRAGMRCILLRAEGQPVPDFFQKGEVVPAHNMKEVGDILSKILAKTF